MPGKPRKPNPEPARKPPANKAAIDPGAVERLATIGCTTEEIAFGLGIAPSTLFLRMKNDPVVQTAIDKGRALGRSTLRRLQWTQAANGNVTMQIWLGKQLLGQKDKSELSGSEGGPVQVDVRNLSTEQLIAALASQAPGGHDKGDPPGT